VPNWISDPGTGQVLPLTNTELSDQPIFPDMLEIPESKTISLQVDKTLINKKIIKVFKASSPHKFAWYSGDPAGYDELLSGKKILSSRGHGMFVDIFCEDNTCITAGEGTGMRYYPPTASPPEKHQLLIMLDDGSWVAFTVAMYGGIWAYKGEFANSYHQCSLNSISPLEDSFDEAYFERIVVNVKNDLSAKALLATEQRIPGLGNGVLQDILFNAGIHPKCKKSALSDQQKGMLFRSLKETLVLMTRSGGRDTEKDLFGHYGGYKTILSRNTVNQPCHVCGNLIRKEAYLGGAVYFCPVCQKL
jgi:formamidopyrimidine-DNA glycosylase